MRAASELIYDQLKQFVQYGKYVIAILPKNDELELVNQYFPIRFEANIIVLDKATYYFMISSNGGFIKRGSRFVSLMTLKADETTWLHILNGHKSLTQEYNRGNVTMSNARANFMYKLVLLSILFETRTRIIRVGRILSFFPISFIRTFLKIILKYIPTLLNRIPSSTMQAIINFTSSLGERFEK